MGETTESVLPAKFWRWWFAPVIAFLLLWSPLLFSCFVIHFLPSLNSSGNPAPPIGNPIQAACNIEQLYTGTTYKVFAGFCLLVVCIKTLLERILGKPGLRASFLTGLSVVAVIASAFIAVNILMPASSLNGICYGSWLLSE